MAQQYTKGFPVSWDQLHRDARALAWRLAEKGPWQSIVAGSIMMWARGISEFGAVVILTYHPMIAPVLVFERFEAFGLDYARPVAVLLIIVTVLAFVLLRVLTNRGRQA